MNDVVHTSNAAPKIVLNFEIKAADPKDHDPSHIECVCGWPMTIGFLVAQRILERYPIFTGHLDVLKIGYCRATDDPAIFVTFEGILAKRRLPRFPDFKFSGNICLPGKSEQFLETVELVVGQFSLKARAFCRVQQEGFLDIADGVFGRIGAYLDEPET